MLVGPPEKKTRFEQGDVRLISIMKKRILEIPTLSSILIHSLLLHHLFFPLPLPPAVTMPPAVENNNPKGKRISLATIANATQQLNQGHSVREVANSLRISIGSAVNIRNRNKENIPPPKTRSHSKISPRTKEVLARQFNTGHLRTLRDGQRFIQETDGVQVHVETIRRNLRDEGIRAYVQQKRPNLKPNHIQERLAFARTHINWTVDDWKRVMFSDESMISRVGSFGRKFYYSGHEHKRLLPHQVRPMAQGGGGKIMIWGCITFFGPGDLSRITGTLNAELYLEALNEYVLATFAWYGMDPTVSIFQQDNSRVHTANLMQEWFAEQDFTVLEWPTNSPDLNIIEHVWAYLKHRLSLYEQAPASRDELWERVQDIWTSIPLDYLHELYESMPRRMMELIRKRGGPIKY